VDRETTSPLSHQITVGRAPVKRDTRAHGTTVGTASSLELTCFKPKRLSQPRAWARLERVQARHAGAAAAGSSIGVVCHSGAPGHGAFRLNMQRPALARSTPHAPPPPPRRDLMLARMVIEAARVAAGSGRAAGRGVYGLCCARGMPACSGPVRL